MNIFVDIVILLIAGITIFLAGKRGFITTAVTAASSLIALIMVFCFTGLVSDLLKQTALKDLLHPVGVKAVTMVLIFVATTLLLKLCAKFLTALVTKLPFVKKANTALGLVLGLVLALVRILVFCAAVNLISSTAGLLQADFLVVNADDTILYRLFDAIQILQFLF